MKRKVLALIVVVALAAVAACALSFFGASGKPFTKGVYGAPPRTQNGSLDMDRLFLKVSASGADTYNFLLTDTPRDLSELERLLPEAQRRGIKIWATILPPSELSPEMRMDMRYVDYVGTAKKIAGLSVRYENLEAWSIDNVAVDSGFFTASYLSAITSGAKEANPELLFIPVVYYANVASSGFSERASFFDGVQFYYTHFPAGESDESAVLLPMLQELRESFDGKVVLGIYASPWSKDYPTSPSYVEQLLKLAKQHTDGAMIYTMDQEGEKLAVVKGQFGG
ncbi:MAG: hypothetical protein V1813_04215 [Candidatus Aenigmatarchaeota archaeon]